MSWYQVLNPEAAGWLTLAVLVITFGLLLYRRFNIAYVSLSAAAFLILLGVTNPATAFTRSINWDVLAIYWGYGMLAITFRESRLPAWMANRLLTRVTREKHALFFLCVLAAFLSSFMPNPVVVIMLAPLAIELASRLKTKMFPYLVALAISSNVVTTVTMIADPPALILATATGMDFLDFYWFQNKISLGTLSAAGTLVALGTLLILFRKLKNPVTISPERIEVSLGPLWLFLTSILALVMIPWQSFGVWNHQGLVGLALGLLSLTISGKRAWSMMKEFDWNTVIFLIGVFIIVAAAEEVGLLADFAGWLGHSILGSSAVYLAVFIWVSVLLSSFVDNVPYTVLMIPVCTEVARILGVNAFPLYFGMLIGTGVGGNITPVGATANVIACGMLEKRGYRVRLSEYMSISIPFSLSAVAVSHVLLQLVWL
jgi:Na+/H+ antiporter NhaD/arsenite permease-like protein